MEARRSEPEFDDLEKLLCEIPNVTTANPHSGGSVPKMVHLDDEGKNQLNKLQQSPVKGVQTEEMHLPDEQYNLTSAFAELRFGDVMPIEAINTPLAKSLQNYVSSLDGSLPNSVKKQTFSNMDSPLMVVPSFHSPNNVPYGFYGFDMPKVGHESTNLSRFNNPQEFRIRHQIANCQPFENFSANVPAPFLSNVPVPAVQFPVMSDHQQLVMQPRARLPYLNPQAMNQQRQFSWRNMEEEQLYGMQQPYLHLQKLHNQQLENGNIASRLLSMNTRQPHFEVPISNQYEQFKQEPFWNSYAMPKSSNQSNPPFSPVELKAMKAWDKMGKQSYPDKNLTRSLGLNAPNAVNFGPVGVNEPLSHVIQHGKVLPNGHFLRSFSNSGCYQLDNVRPWDPYPGLTNLKRADLKSPPIKYNSLNEVIGKIYFMAKDQYGCRFLQRKFAEGTQKDVALVFNEVIDHIVELMTDPFGNYLVQKLLEVCNEDQHMKILQSITRNPGELVRISCDMHGTRAVQKIIETLKTPKQFSMVVSSLEPNAVALMKNMNGNHVAQKCLQHLVPEYNEFLFEAANINSVELATDRHGCCVLQKCLGHADGERRHRLICEIAANALILSQDPFGNYVVQFVFDLRLPWATEEILEQLDGSYGDLSVQKHSSNVVEKCLKCASEERHTRIIQELIDHPRLDQIMQDAFGNYVIQAAVNQSTGGIHAKMVDAIKPHAPVLRNSPYGKKVLACLGLRK